METNDLNTNNSRHLSEPGSDQTSVFVESEYEFDDSSSTASALNPSSSPKPAAGGYDPVAYTDYYDAPTVEVEYEFEDEVVVPPLVRYYSPPVVAAAVPPIEPQPSEEPVVEAEVASEPAPLSWQPEAVQETLAPHEPAVEEAVVSEPEAWSPADVSSAYAPIAEPTVVEQIQTADGSVAEYLAEPETVEAVQGPVVFDVATTVTEGVAESAQAEPGVFEDELLEASGFELEDVAPVLDQVGEPISSVFEDEPFEATGFEQIEAPSAAQVPDLGQPEPPTAEPEPAIAGELAYAEVESSASEAVEPPLDVETLQRLEAETVESDAEKLREIERISRSLNEELDTLVSLKEKADMLVEACDDAKKREHASSDQIDSLLNTQSRLNSMLETATGAIARNQETLGALLSDFEDVVEKLPPGLKSDGEQRLARIKSETRELHAAAPPQALGVREEPEFATEPTGPVAGPEAISELLESDTATLHEETLDVAAVPDAEVLSEPAVMEPDEELPDFDFEETIEPISAAEECAPVSSVGDFSDGFASELELPDFDIDEEFESELEPFQPLDAPAVAGTALVETVETEFAEQSAIEPIEQLEDVEEIVAQGATAEASSVEDVVSSAEAMPEFDLDFEMDSVEEPVAELAEEAPAEFGFEVAEEPEAIVEEPVVGFDMPVAELAEEAPAEFGFDVAEEPAAIVEEPVAEFELPVAELEEEVPAEFGFDVAEEPAAVVEEPVAEFDMPVAELEEEAPAEFGFDVAEEPAAVVEEPVAGFDMPVAELEEEAPAEFGFDAVEEPAAVVEEPVAEFDMPVAELEEEAPAEFGFEVVEEPAGVIEEPVAEFELPVAELAEEAPAGFGFEVVEEPAAIVEEPAAEFELPVAELEEEAPAEFGFEVVEEPAAVVEEPVAEFEMPVVELAEEAPAGFEFDLATLPTLGEVDQSAEFDQPTTEFVDTTPEEPGLDTAEFAPPPVDEPVAETEPTAAETLEELPDALGFDLASLPLLNVDEPVPAAQQTQRADESFELRIDDGSDTEPVPIFDQAVQQPELEAEGQMDIDFEDESSGAEPGLIESPGIGSAADSDFDLATISTSDTHEPSETDFDLAGLDVMAQDPASTEFSDTVQETSFDLALEGSDAATEAFDTPSESAADDLVSRASAGQPGLRTCPRCGKEQKHNRSACVYCYTQLDAQTRGARKEVKAKPVRSAVPAQSTSTGDQKKSVFGFLRRSK